MNIRKKTYITLGAVSLGLCLLLIVFLLTRNVSSVFSDFIALNFTRWWVLIFGGINSLVPFSVFELMVIAVIVSSIILIILLIRCFVKRNFHKAFKGMLIVLIICLSLGNFYTLFVGYLYNRSPVPVPQSSQKYDNAMVIDAATYFLNDYNALAEKFPRDTHGNVISPYSMKELSKKIGEEFNALDSKYFFKYTPRGKKLLNSWFMTATDISGITCVPFGEPVVNGQMIASDITQVLAHEMAHAKGVMKEGECNYVSYYLLLNSDDDYLRYCGYFAAYGYILGAVDEGQKNHDNYKALSSAISPLIRKEQKNSFEFWSSGGKINEFFGKIGDFFNNLYLKMSGVDNGSNSYGDASSDGGIFDTGETDPDTGDIIYDVVHTSIQKMCFYIYENKTT